MAKGTDIVNIARPHIGESYHLGALAPKNNANWKGPWDCAEFASWCLYQASSHLYGSQDNGANPSSADAYTGFWQRDVKKLGRSVTISVAAATPGAFVLRNPAANLIGHIAICAGAGKTVEAHSTNTGVIENVVAGRRWDSGILIPWIDYGAVINVSPVAPPGLILRLKLPNMKGDLVERVQRALEKQGFDPGTIDKAYGPHTAAAVSAFQSAKGLVADGEVGPNTAEALGVKWKF